MSDHKKLITKIHAEEYKQLTDIIINLKKTIEGLKNDNKNLMKDNTRLRKSEELWMKKSIENLRESFRRDK